MKNLILLLVLILMISTGGFLYIRHISAIPDYSSGAPADMQPGLKRLTIQGSSGALSVEIYNPAIKKGARCPMVIMMHGLTSNMNTPLLQNIAKKLMAADIGYVKFDFNGHGYSDGNFKDMTIPKEIDDARRVYNYVRDLDYVSTISLLGHSQGGVVAAILAGEMQQQIHKLVLLAPAGILDNGSLIKTMGSLVSGSDGSVNFMGYKVGKEYVDTLAELEIYKTASKYNGPVCIIHGSADNIVPEKYGRKFADIYDDCELNIFNGSGHGLTESKTYKIVIEFLTK